uniref:Uncharacterized protein n=1 Tax=Rhipicephalus microplus TaxID=6941 RepID=A0A6G5AJA4_RHIMP
MKQPAQRKHMKNGVSTLTSAQWRHSTAVHLDMSFFGVQVRDRYVRHFGISLVSMHRFSFPYFTTRFQEPTANHGYSPASRTKNTNRHSLPLDLQSRVALSGVSTIL